MHRFSNHYFDSVINESVAMGKIPHIHKSNVDQLINFLTDDFNNYEISEKVDGINFSFGLQENEVYGKSKYGKPMTDPNQFRQLKEIHEVFVSMGDLLEYIKQHDFKQWHNKILEQYGNELKKKFNVKDIKSLAIFGEMFNSNKTNTLLYDSASMGKVGAFVVFGIKIDNGIDKNGIDISTDPLSEKIMHSFVESFNDKGGWKVYYKQEVKLNFNKQLIEDLQNFIKYNTVTLKSMKRSPQVTEAKAKAKAKLVELLIKFKKDLLLQTANVKPMLGGNTTIEGLVIRNKKTGGIIKVVDTDRFTEMNNKNWEGRRIRSKDL